MASQFQNRLIGTLILVVLSVIILPALLNGKKKHDEDENVFSAIPLLPETEDHHKGIAAVDQPLPARPQQTTLSTPPALQVMDDAPSLPVKRQPDKPEDIKRDTQRVDVVRETAPSVQAFVVQLGALKNAVRVNEIVATLRRSGYKAFTVPAVPVNGKITRLYVGPDTSRQKLQSVLPELNSLSGLNGQVKMYSIGR